MPGMMLCNLLLSQMGVFLFLSGGLGVLGSGAPGKKGGALFLKLMDVLIIPVGSSCFYVNSEEFSLNYFF